MQSQTSISDADEESDEIRAYIDQLEKKDLIKAKKCCRLAKQHGRLIRDILKSPWCFFALESFGDGEVNAVLSATAGKEWREILAMAIDGEKQKLKQKKVSESKLDSLLEFGWAWKHQGAFIAFRDKSAFAKHRPKNSDRCCRMIFVFKAYSWVPSANLKAMAGRRLGVTNPTSVGNVTGCYTSRMVSMIEEKRAYADFLARHGDRELRIEAKGHLSFCDEFSKRLSKGGDLNLASVALNFAWQDSTLRVGAEPEMLEKIIKQHSGTGSRKPDREGIRSIVEKAYCNASDSKKAFATKAEVISELKASFGMSNLGNDGLYRIGERKLSELNLNHWLERIREKFKDIYPKQERAGRPPTKR